MEKFKSKFKRGVSLEGICTDCLYYNVSCDCGDGECGASLSIEVDDKFGVISVIMCRNLEFEHWRFCSPGIRNFIKKVWFRLISAIKLLFTGNLKTSGDFVLTDLEHIDSFIEALQEGKEYCLRSKEEREINPGVNRING